VLPKVTRPATGECLSADGKVIVRRDEDHRRGIMHGRQPPAQLQPGYAFKLDVQHQAVEARMLSVGEERLRGRIGDGLEPGHAQQPTERAAQALVVVRHRDVGVLASIHQGSRNVAEAGRHRLLPFGEGRSACQGESEGRLTVRIRCPRKSPRPDRTLPTVRIDRAGSHGEGRRGMPVVRR